MIEKDLDVPLTWGPVVRLESSVAPRILTVSGNWITESSNLTDVRPDIVFKRYDVLKSIASDLVGLSAIPLSQN